MLASVSLISIDSAISRLQTFRMVGSLEALVALFFPSTLAAFASIIKQKQNRTLFYVTR